MYLKIHQTQKGKIVAACDKELLGSVLDDGNAYFDLDRYRGFYAGEPAGEEQLRAALRAFSSANLVGERAVGVALKMALAGKKDVMYINKTPHIQLYNL